MSGTDAYNYFLSQGWSSTQSAGIVGNLLGESNLNPYAVGDSGAAFGIAQWHAPRQAQFQSLFGIPIQSSTLDQQLQFVNWELNNTEVGAGNALRQTNTVSGATQSVMQNYERPADSSSFGSRLSQAVGVLNKATGVIDTVKDAIGGGTGILSSIPVLGPLLGGVGSILGIGGDSCGYICQFRKWLDESHFWQRVAIGVLAVILIGGALYLLGTGSVRKSITEAVK